MYHLQSKTADKMFIALWRLFYTKEGRGPNTDPSGAPYFSLYVS